MALILLADDDILMLDLYRTKLERFGHTVETVSEPSEVVAKAKEVKPQAIFLDRRLGEGDGLLLLEEMRKQEETKNTPVLVLSNLDPAGEDLERLKSLAPAEYHVKEKTELSELVERIEELTK